MRFNFLKYLIPVFLVLFSSFSLEAAEVATTFGLAVSVEGKYSTMADNSIDLNSGATLKIAASDKIPAQEITAHGEHVRVVLGESGVQSVSGLFAMTRVGEDGTKTHIPGKLTATRMRLNPEPEMALAYTRGETAQPQASNWVTESEGIFRLKGLTSVERIHPPTEDLPEILISMSGKNSEVILSSNMATMGWYEDCPANFWKEAYDDLNVKKQALRDTVVDPQRVGARAYQSFIRESMQGLNKLSEGYDMLRQKRYTDEVLRRMVQGRADIPRLDVGSFNIVAGEGAYTLEIFRNWLGDGRVMSNVAYLTNAEKEGAYPSLSFVLGDKSGKIGEDTRLVITEGDAYLEVARPGSETWNMRSPNQFDYLAEVAFSPNEESMKLDFDLDVTGFLLRKGMRVVGQVTIGSLEVTPNSLNLVYQPTAASRKVASDFSGYVALSRIVLFPDRDRILDDYRPEEISDETWDFLGMGFDHLAEALGQSNVDQIDSLVVEFKQIEGKQWGLMANFKGKNGRSGQAEYKGELSENPVTFLWEKLKGSQDTTEWLGIDLGFQGVN